MDSRLFHLNPNFFGAVFMTTRSELVKKGKYQKVGIALCAGGAILSFIFLSWVLGVIFCVGAGYLFVKLLKTYASSGQRF
ncbi:MAG: hypothetical protein ACI4VB_01325 [Bradymonadia bacterium]